MPDRDRVRALAQELLDTWTSDPTGTFTATKGRPLMDYPVLHALTTHTHRLAEAVLLLHDRGMVLEAMPLIRLAFECGLTAQWVAQCDDALWALGNEEMRQRKALVATVVRSGLNVEQSELDRILRSDVEQLDTSLNGSARNFEALCNDLEPGGAQAYMLYRTLSAHSHASLTLADQYVQEPSSSAYIARLRMRPRDMEDEYWLDILVSSMVWAGRAADFRHPGRPRRAQLRAAARELGIAEFMRRSGGSWVRRHRRQQRG